MSAVISDAVSRTAMAPRRVGLQPGPLLLAAHVPLALAMSVSPTIATAHVVLTLVVAVLAVAQSRALVRIAQVAGYLAASDVLWRMTDALFFHEGAKYAVTAILVVALFRFFRGWRSVGVPAAYLATGMPAVLLSLMTVGLSDAARQLISANLSGPICLAVSVAFFLQIRSTLDGLRSVLWAMAGPIVGVAVIAAVQTRAEAGRIVFKGASNFVTSGGFGPNQVSAVVGLGALLCLLLALSEPSPRLRLGQLVLAGALLTQAALTFSRGGLVNVVVALAFAGVALVRHARWAGRLLVGVAAIAAIGAWVVIPRLDSFTGGAFSERYTDLDPSSRTQLAGRDVDVFRENAVSGVGLGVSSSTRLPGSGERVAAHTEYTRLLAEQGLLGVLAIVLLTAIAARAVIRAQPGVPRAFALAFAAWTFTEMSHAAMRIATVSFVFALAVAASQIDRSAEDSIPRVHR